MRAVLLALLLLGCGEVHFVDPNPPRLFRTAASYTSAAVDEPVVWIAILDLFFEDASGCDWAREATLLAVRQGFAAAGTRQLELAAQDLSPDCRERGQLPLDVQSVRAQFDSAQAAFPGAHVRPVIVYLDDVDLLTSAETLAALHALRSRPDAPALVWTISHASVSAQLGADRAIAWSYAGDGDLVNRVGTAVKTDLPLQTTAALSSGPVPLLTASQLETTREFKLCKNPDASASNYPLVGPAHVLDRAHPPTIMFAVPQLVAVPKSQFQNSTFDITVEGCMANCDRYYIGEAGADPVRWDEANRCLLRNG
jgi:hypothetical protein